MNERQNKGESSNLGLSGDGDTVTGAQPETDDCYAQPRHLCTAGMSALPATTMIDEMTLAGHFQVSTRTIRRMVAHGQIPEGVKIGGRRVWIVGKVIEYVTVEAERLAVEARRRALRLSAGRI